MSKLSKPPQLKPHPGLFLVLCVVFAVWMVLLLVLYFWTVYPRRHPVNHSGTAWGSSKQMSKG